MLVDCTGADRQQGIGAGIGTCGFHINRNVKRLRKWLVHGMPILLDYGMLRMLYIRFIRRMLFIRRMPFIRYNSSNVYH